LVSCLGCQLYLGSVGKLRPSLMTQEVASRRAFHSVLHPSGQAMGAEPCLETGPGADRYLEPFLRRAESPRTISGPNQATSVSYVTLTICHGRQSAALHRLKLAQASVRCVLRSPLVSPIGSLQLWSLVVMATAPATFGLEAEHCSQQLTLLILLH
jgi:hypothetical protein